MNPFENMLLNKLYPFSEGLIDKDILVVLNPISGFNNYKLMLLADSIVSEFGILSRTKIEIKEIGEVEQSDLSSYRAIWTIGYPSVSISCTSQQEHINSPSLNFSTMVSNYEKDYAYIEQCIERIKNSIVSTIPVKLISSLDELNRVVELSRIHNFAWDTETIDLHDLTMLMLSLTFKINGAYQNYVIPVHHEDSPLPTRFSLEAIKKILWSPSIKVAHNLKFDMHVVKQNLGEFPPILSGDKLLMYDTMLAYYAVFNKQFALGLKPLAKNLFHSEDYEQALQVELKKKFKRKADWKFDSIPLNIFYQYAGLDSYYTYKLMENIKLPLSKIHNGEVSKMYKTHLMPTLEAVAKMEDANLHIDATWTQGYLSALEELRKDIATGVSEIPCIKENFDEFNIASTHNLQNLFFKVLKVKTRGKTKTGFSTDVNTMKLIHEEEEGDASYIAQKVVEYRKAVKMEGYLKAFLENKNQDNFLKPNFALHGTTSGRLSSFGDFNAQNIPSRTKMGIKKCITSRFGKEGCIINIDYKTLEFRIASALSKDPHLHDILMDKDKDLHTATASLVFKKPEEEVSPEERFVAKTTNFSIIYGAGYKKVAEITGMNPEFVKDMLVEYKKTYSALMDAMVRTQDFAERKGYVKTPMGRVRPFPELLNTRLRKYDKFKYLREAYNMLVQSLAADIGLRALRGLTEVIEKRNLKTRIINQVHDSLLFDVPFDEFETLIPIILEEMEKKAVPSIIKLPVPVEISYGPNYEDQIELDLTRKLDLEEVRGGVGKADKKAFEDYLEIEDFAKKIITSLD